MENENLEPEVFDENQFKDPETLTINVSEAFRSLFQKECFKKALVVIGLLLLPVIIAVLTVAAFVFSEKTPAFALCGVVLTLLTIVALLFSSITLYGYFLLYSHDRALRKETLYRTWSGETLKESIIGGFKSYVMGLVQLPFVIIAVPLLIAMFLFNMHIDLLNFVCDFLFAVVFGVPIAKIFAYFIKDMNPVSLFKWGEAFKFTKGVKGAFLVPFVPFVFTWIVSVIATLILMGISQLIFGAFDYEQISSIVGLIDIPFAIIGAVLYCNLLGQYAYNSIRQNEGKDPETLPNEISKDGMAIVIATVAALIGLAILGMVAALTIPSLVNRQSDLAAKVKMKKAIANYEDIAAVYIIENTPENAKGADEKAKLKGLTGKNCESLGNYFKVVAQDGCAIITPDGVYWEFDPENGSALIMDNPYSGKYAVHVGQCEDGSVNCAQEYPEVSEILNK